MDHHQLVDFACCQLCRFHSICRYGSLGDYGSPAAARKRGKNNMLMHKISMECHPNVKDTIHGSRLERKSRI